MKTKIFFDTKFTEMRQNATLISIGLISESGQTFYAELNDYDKNQIDESTKEKLIYKDEDNKEIYIRDDDKYSVTLKCNKEKLQFELNRWFQQFEEVEMWGDCLAYDWVLFCEIFGGASNIPKNIYHIPFDLSTLFKEKEINPNIIREYYAFDDECIETPTACALWNAKVTRACYDKLMSVTT